MLKIFKTLLTSFVLSFLFVVPVLAQDTETEVGTAVEGMPVESVTTDYILPPNPNPSAGFLGQDHYYSVVFRGNGEAVVSARVNFTNKEDADTNKVLLRVPRIDPREISVYQIIRERTCVRYQPKTYDPLLRKYIPENPACLEYREPDYYQTYGNIKYQKADFEYKGDTITVTLPQKVASQKSGSFFVYFRAFGYAKKNIFGAYNYTFETLKVEDEIRTLRVGIATDSDLVLKGVKGEVQYRYEEPAFSGLEAAGVAMAPQKSVAMDRYVNQIGQGRISKSASNLSPLESYTVSGSYASSVVKLYGKGITIAVLVFVLVAALIVLAIRWMLRKLKNVGTKTATSTKSPDQVAGMSPEVKAGLMAAGIGFVVSFLIAGYTVFVFLVGAGLMNLINYRYEVFVVLSLVIISFCVYSVLLFGPAIYLGAKKGVGWGIATVIMTILWLFFYLLVGVFIVFLLSGGRGTPPIFEPLLGM